MSAPAIDKAFGLDPFFEKLIALRESQPAIFARLGAVARAALRDYEIAKSRSPRLAAVTAEGAEEDRATPAVTLTAAPTEIANGGRAERRRERRMIVHLPARWEDESGNYDATIGDLSSDGCFVLTSGRARVDKFLKLSVALPRTGWVNLCGRVTNWSEEIGFGLRFVRLTREGGRLSAEMLREIESGVAARKLTWAASASAANGAKRAG